MRCKWCAPYNFLNHIAGDGILRIAVFFANTGPTWGSPRFSNRKYAFTAPPVLCRCHSSPNWPPFSSAVLRPGWWALCLSNPRTTFLQAKKLFLDKFWLQDTTRFERVTSVFKFFNWSKQTYGSVVKVYSIEFWQHGINAGKGLCHPMAFCVALSKSVNWHAHFYIAALSVKIISWISLVAI